MSAGSWTDTHSAGTPEGAMLEQMVCYLNLQTLTESLQILQIGGIGPLIVTSNLFLPFISPAIMYFFFLMFNLVSFLTLWIPYVPPIFNIYYPNACI